MESPQSIIDAENERRTNDDRTDLIPAVTADPTIDNLPQLGFALRAAARVGDTVIFPEVYSTSSSVQIRDGKVRWDVEEPGKGGLRLIGDPDVRVRPNVRFDGGDIYLGPLLIEGVMPDDGPAKSPREKEAQPNVWLASVERFTACGTKLSHPRGDWLYCGLRDPQEGEPSRNVGLYGIETTRGGRAGFVLNGVEGFDLRGSKLGKCGASLIDYEASSRGILRDAWIVGNEHYDAEGLFAHLHHEGQLDGFYLIDNYRHGAPVQIDCVPSGTRYRNVNVIGNAWDKPQTGGRMMRFWHVDGVQVVRNVGEYSRRRSPDPVDVLDCTNVTENNPGMIPV